MSYEIAEPLPEQRKTGYVPVLQVIRGTELFELAACTARVDRSTNKNHESRWRIYIGKRGEKACPVLKVNGETFGTNIFLRKVAEAPDYEEIYRMVAERKRYGS